MSTSSEDDEQFRWRDNPPIKQRFFQLPINEESIAAVKKLFVSLGFELDEAGFDGLKGRCIFSGARHDGGFQFWSNGQLNLVGHRIDDVINSIEIMLARPKSSTSDNSTESIPAVSSAANQSDDQFYYVVAQDYRAGRDTTPVSICKLEGGKYAVTIHQLGYSNFFYLRWWDCTGRFPSIINWPDGLPVEKTTYRRLAMRLGYSSTGNSHWDSVEAAKLDIEQDIANGRAAALGEERLEKEQAERSARLTQSHQLREHNKPDTSFSLGRWIALMCVITIIVYGAWLLTHASPESPSPQVLGVSTGCIGFDQIAWTGAYLGSEVKGWVLNTCDYSIRAFPIATFYDSKDNVLLTQKEVDSCCILLPWKAGSTLHARQIYFPAFSVDYTKVKRVIVRATWERYD